MKIRSFFLTVSVICLVLALYIFLDRYPIRWDLTANKDFSFSKQTIDTLKNLKQEVKITAFFRRGEDLDDVFIRRKVDDVLHEYAVRSSKITYKMTDLDTDVTRATQYKISTDGTIVFEFEKNKKEIYKSQLFDYSHAAEESPPNFIGEGLFTNALLKVTATSQKTICVLSGHGERNFEDPETAGFSLAKEYLVKNNYDVLSLSLITSSVIPQECLILLVAGPKDQFLKSEDKLIHEWIQKRGRLLLLSDPQTPPPFLETLKSLKVHLDNNMVLDPERHFVLGPQYPAPILSNHPITKDLKEENPILFSARSLTQETESEEAHFLKTSPKAGSLTLGVAIMGPRKSPSGKAPAKPRLSRTPLYVEGGAEAGNTANGEFSEVPLAIIVGDSDFASNSLIQAPGNLDLFLNMVSWLVGDKDQITIRPKTPDFRNITLTAKKARFIAWWTQLVYPLLILLGVGSIWFRRRHL